MTHQRMTFPGPVLQLFAAAEDAIAQIPPAFPLTATVAVNPFLGQAGENRAMAAARLARAGGLRVAQDRAQYAAMLADGRIAEPDLQAAAKAAGLDAADLRAAADAPQPGIRALPMVADLARDATGTDWPEFVEDRVGLWASAHFDRGQAFWPALSGGAFVSWRAFASRDLTTGLAGLTGFNAYVADLRGDAAEALSAACATLGVTAEAAPLYFHRLLMSMGGWAQYARHLGWLAERDGGREETCFALLAIAATWEAALLERWGDRIGDGWAKALESYAAPIEPSRDDLLDAALQDAADRAAERRLAETLAAPGAAGETGTDRPDLQAAFCIDVRSEILRRALEASDPGMRTLGFAGFFGLATAHRSEGSDLVEARAPVLLRPGVASRDLTGASADRALRIKRRAVRAWGRFKMAAVSAFAFVEAAGPLYAAKLLRDSTGVPHHHGPGPAPAMNLPEAERIKAAATVLRAMSLTDGFAPMILIAGHGSHVTNAPHASALQCGACGGHAGDVNARLLAALLNDPAVRAGLPAEGITVPEDTLFIAGLHDTVTDEVTLFEDHGLARHAASLRRLKATLAQASALARAERAQALPRAGTAAALLSRGHDWAELRPEWGLAGCSAFIAAPRHRSADRDLAGRAFLHDYDWRRDDGFRVLELILTAPVVVASWISLQYYGSSVAPEAFGAGNKLIHNVTGGIGVVEGNGGALRAGLPLQSVHDGDALRHEPLRLTVAVEAPREAIADILSRHDSVARLFDNGWLALYAMDEDGRMTWRHTPDGWQTVPEAA
ncbi:YbcC family protein [Citreimonas sp.]|uniref:YbcC family protein n=1 Tax=Citreimonas sp. TaxID=3036715 RepID=UPI00405A483E